MKTRHCMLLIGILLGIGAGGWWLWQVRQPSALQAADTLFSNGQYHEALASYQQLAHTRPSALLNLRIGMLHTIRGEARPAQIALATALDQGLSGDDYALARLYQGALAARVPGYGDPAALWERVPASSTIAAVRSALLGDYWLRNGNLQQAAAHFQAAIGLPEPWMRFAQQRLELIAALNQPLDQLPVPSAQPASQPVLQLTLPLLTTLDQHAEEIRLALTAQGDQRQLALGQVLVTLGLPHLAITHFAAVPADSDAAIAAQAGLAYATWLTGDQATGMQQLRDLVNQNPDDARARALLALIALSLADKETARAQLEIIRATAPGEPATHLAWGQWYMAQADYLAAGAALRRALDRAAPEERGTYALHLARFHLESDLLVCEQGLPAAETATTSLQAAASAWAVLAQARLACGDPAGALAAANQAYQRNPHDPEALFQLGQALAASGNLAQARTMLIAAADAAPASPWQRRAELRLAELP